MWCTKTMRVASRESLGAGGMLAAAIGEHSKSMSRRGRLGESVCKEAGLLRVDDWTNAHLYL